MKLIYYSLIAFIWSIVWLYSLLSHQFFLIPVLFLVSLFIYILIRFYNDSENKKYLPILDVKLESKQKKYVLKKLKYNQIGIDDSYIEEYIEKVRFDWLEERDIDTLNKLLTMRIQIRFR